VNNLTPTPHFNLTQSSQIFQSNKKQNTNLGSLTNHLRQTFIIFFYQRWMRHLLKLGLSRQIEENDVYKCCNNHKSDRTTESFKKHWNNELNKTKPSLLNAFLKIYGIKVIVLGLCFAIIEITCK
jgi:hypothetical protein